MENITLAHVGNGKSVHVYTEYTSKEITVDGRTTGGHIFKNTACGALNTGSNFGARTIAKINTFEGEASEVTCKRCMKSAEYAEASVAPEAEVIEEEAPVAARQRAEAPVADWVEDLSPAPVETAADRRLAQAATFRREAQGCRDERARSWEDSDSDGFLSQWANQEMAHRYDGAAKILEDGGTVVYHAVFNLDGEILDARESKGDYGMYYYVPSAEDKARYFTPSAASKEETAIKNNFKKGYYFGKARYSVTFDRFAAISKAGIEDMVEIVDNGQDRLRELGLL